MPYKKPLKQKMLNSKILVIGLLLILILIIYANYKHYNSQKNISQQTNNLTTEIAKLEKNNQELIHLIEYFASSDYIEKEAREKLNLAQPGEKVVILSDTHNQNESQSLDQNISLKNSPVNWWNYFFE